VRDRAEINPGKAEVAAVRPWSSFSFRDFALIWFASALTGVASQIRQVSNLYQVYQISGSSMKLGLAGFFQSLPFVLLGLFGGALADTFDRKKLIIVTHCSILALTLGLGLLTAVGSVEVWHLYAFSLMTSLVQVFHNPARAALVPRMVPKSHVMNAVALTTMVHQASMLVGPVIAGVLIDHLGLALTYFVCGGLFLPALVGILAIRTSGKPEGERRRLRLRSMIEGVEFIWSQRIILSLFLLDFGVVLVGYYQPMLPVFASEVFEVGATGLGTLYSAPAVGALLGMAVLLLAGNFRRKGALVVAASIVFAVGLALLGMTKWFWLGIIAVAALGFADSIGVTMRRTLVPLLAPDAMLGRASSLISVFAQCTNALGALVIGATVELLGASNAVLLSSVLCIFVVVGINWIFPQLWRYRSA
jgi:MFS family permease